MTVARRNVGAGHRISRSASPGRLQWLVADLLSKQGLTVANESRTGQTRQDRKLLTGDSPLASNEFGLLTADAPPEDAQAKGWAREFVARHLLFNRGEGVADVLTGARAAVLGCGPAGKQPQPLFGSRVGFCGVADQ